MATYSVTLSDQSVIDIDDADAYQQEGPLTTFFRLDEGRRVIDSWSMRLASFRTNDIVAVQRKQLCRARRDDPRSRTEPSRPDGRHPESRTPGARAETLLAA